MRWLRFIGKNFKTLLTNKPLLLALIAFSQVVCVVVLLMVSGFINDSNMSNVEVSENERLIVIQLYTVDSSDYTGRGYDSPYTVKQAKPKLKELIDFLGDDFDYLTFAGRSNNSNASYTIFSSVFSSKALARYNFTEEERKVIISTDRIIRLDPQAFEAEYNRKVKVGDKIDINGVEYTIAVAEKYTTGLVLPYAALQDEFTADVIYVGLDDICTSQRNNEIIDKIGDLFNYQDIQPPLARDLIQEQSRHFVYVVMAAIIIIVLLNLSLIYAYVLAYRRKSFAAMSICGCSKAKIFIMYLCELTSIFVITYWIGVLIYHFGILPLLGRMYPTFYEFMNAWVYIVMFIIYMVCAVVVMSVTISRFITKTTLNMERGNQ